MPETTKLLVLYCPAGGGHKAAALAIAEAAEKRDVRAEVLDALELTPSWFARAYVGAHLTSTEHAPRFYGQAYSALNRRMALGGRMRSAFDRALGARLCRYAVERSPSAVVSTHFFPLAALGRARLSGSLAAPLVAAVTDYAAHAFWAERGVDRFCVPAGVAARDLARHGAPVGSIVATGIPVRRAFGTIAPLVAPRPGEPLRALITSGGFGVGPMLEVIQSFAGVPDVFVTVVCGANPQRVEQARAAAQRVGVRAEVLGFEPDMPRRMAEAHVIVGKPGGLTVSESLAARRPMVLVGTCPGQEAMNEAWLVENGAAVAASPREAGRLVASLREGRLMELAAASCALAAPRAADRVVDVALRAALDAREHLPHARRVA